MRTNLKPIAGIVLWGALAVSAPGAAEPNVIRAIDVAEREGAVELSIQGTRAPSYTVFKLQDPPRLVVDLAGADVSQVASPVEVGKAGVIAVSTAQYKDERSAVGRVIVALEGARRYEVTPRGDAVVVKVLAEGTEAKSAPVVEVATAAPAPTVAPAAPVAATPAPAATAAPTASQAPAAAPAEKVVVAEEMHLDAAPAADDHVVSRRVDEARVSAPARAVTGVTASKGHIVLKADGDVGRIEVIELRDPPRLVLDLHGVSRAPTKAVKATTGSRRSASAGPKARSAWCSTPRARSPATR